MKFWAYEKLQLRAQSDFYIEPDYDGFGFDTPTSLFI
jgi:hypothetical protein